MAEVEKSRKIVYFLDFPYGTGGSSRVLLTQAGILSKCGCDVVVAIPSDENGMHISLYDELCAYFSLTSLTVTYPVSTCMEGIDIEGSLRVYNEIVKLLTREKPDLVHSVQVNIAVELAARELGIPHLMNIYPTDLDVFSIKWMDIYPHYHSADSELFVKRWGEGLGISSRCIRVAYENKRKKPRKAVEEPDSGALHILMVGVLAEHKNQLEALRFISICIKAGLNVTLTILGDNDNLYGKKCLEFVERHNLDKRVFFEGFVVNVEDYFAQADVMVLSSTVESYPGVIVESMANKVPIISTPVAGITELLQDGHTCFLTKGYQGEDIYEAFGRYLECRQNGRLCGIIEQAYGCYLQNHSYEAVGKQLTLYYDWICRDYAGEAERLQANDIKSLFESFIQEKCEKEMDSFTRRSIWFLYHLNLLNTARPFQRIVIWGAGLFGQIALGWLDILGCRNRLVGYVDTYKKGMYLGYPILEDKGHALKFSDMVLLAIGDVESCLENMKYLEEIGKKRNKDYFMMLNAPIRI